MNEQLYNYDGSVFRSILTWLAYPIGVLLPMGLILAHVSENGSAEELGAFALFGMVTAFIFEKIQPHAKKWQKNHGDVWADVASFFFSGIGSQVLRAGAIIAVFYLLNLSESFSLALASWPSELPLVAQFILALVVAELGSYWHHRLFHKVHYLWRMHAAHHCVRRLYFLNATRFHIFDLLFATLFSAFPLALLGAPTEMAVLVGIFTGLHGNWQHANVRYKLGWLNLILSGAELHRWHHATYYRHSDSNYGSNLIVWDLVFGSYFLPKDKVQNVDDGIGLGRDDKTYPANSYWKQQIAPLFWNKWIGAKQYYPEHMAKMKAKEAAKIKAATQ